jgi:site-specific recombinase XerD
MHTDRRATPPHLHESAVQRKLEAAVTAAGITKKCTAHTLRHSFAVHDNDADMRHLQRLMGHNDIRTTMRYARLRRAIHDGLKSPADDL